MGVGPRRSLIRLSGRRVSIPSSSGMGVGRNRRRCSPWVCVSIPSSSGMGVGLPKDWTKEVEQASQYLLHQVWVSDSRVWVTGLLGAVSIPSSSGMGVGQLTFFHQPAKEESQYLLHQVWVSDSMTAQAIILEKSQYLLHQVWVSDRTLLDMGGGTRSQYLLHQVWVSDDSLIPDRIGMASLNTFFIRYGCRTLQYFAPLFWRKSQYLLHQVWVSDDGDQGGRTEVNVSIPSSSGMGVGRDAMHEPRYDERSQYLLHQVWVSDCCWCRVEQSSASQYLLHQVWVSDPWHVPEPEPRQEFTTVFGRYQIGCSELGSDGAFLGLRASIKIPAAWARRVRSQAILA